MTHPIVAVPPPGQEEYDMTTAVSRTLASVFEGKPNVTFEERAGYVAVGLG